MDETGAPSASRRMFLTAAGTVAAAVTVAACTRAPEQPAPIAGTGDSDAAPPTGAAVDAVGVHQAGVTRPDPPQAQLLVVVYALTGAPGQVLAALGTAILTLTGGPTTATADIEPGDLTVTVGVGPELVAAVRADLPGAIPLPGYSREEVAQGADGGDVLVQICATDPLLLALAATAIGAAGGGALTERWRQRAFRGPYVAISPTVQAPRNVLGFVDGIVGPHNDEALDADVWLSGPAPVAGGTVMVVRRMRIDLPAFLALGVSAQEAVIGRSRSTTAPLSGGTADADPDLGAKTPDGRYLIPVDAHLRRAHPLAAGVSMMLRRSYSMDEPDAGLLFVSFQNDLSTFTRTMARMDAADALMTYTTTTATGTFLVLPGFGPDQPLGATLFG